MNKGRAILAVMGQVTGLVWRVSLVFPAAFYHRRRALTAFDRELRRHGVPAASRRVLRLRYQAMLPLNPLRYRALGRGHKSGLSPGISGTPDIQIDRDAGRDDRRWPQFATSSAGRPSPSGIHYTS